jgi:transcriptional regulator of acetoin/glycerol metabolism
VLLTDSSAIDAGALGLTNRGRRPDPPPTGDLTLLASEIQEITRALRAEGGRVERAAQRLGIPRSSLYQKIRKYGIAVPRA